MLSAVLIAFEVLHMKLNYMLLYKFLGTKLVGTFCCAPVHVLSLRCICSFFVTDVCLTDEPDWPDWLRSGACLD